MEHGTYTTYCKGACRCAECREANRLQKRRWRGETGIAFTYEGGTPNTLRVVVRPFVRERRVANSNIQITPKGKAYLAAMKEQNVA